MGKALDTEGQDVLEQWLEVVAELFGKIVKQLQDAEKTATTGEDNLNIDIVKPVTVVQTGKQGRPYKVPNQSLLEEAMQPGRRITKTNYARTIKVSTKTLSKYMKKFGIE
ncbi:hypothetical protein PM082_012578 [Marasmius tenuissimus]|nr:hypothetical protein PM082_012578 [Marasmius tenuissimus]